MNIYKLSLGKKYFSNNDIVTLEKNSLVCVHPNTGKGEGEAFINVKKGDIFYVCRSNDSIEFIAMFIDSRPLYSTLFDKEADGWIDREYKLLYKAKNKTLFDRDLNTKIMPRFQSTFTLIDKHDYTLFEKEIVQPVFNVTLSDIVALRNTELEKTTLIMEDYIAMQIDFKELLNDDNALFQKINALTNIELKKIEYTYLKRGDIGKQPVVLLRSKLLELLLKEDKLDAPLISKIKQELDALFETNVYHAWSSNYRILYTFLFDKHKSDLEVFFKQLIKLIQKDLKLENETKIKLVHLDGPQNQGYDRIWFAIYNKINKSQKLAKQLFFELYDGLQYGLLNHADTSKNELKQNTVFNYEDVLNTFKLFKQEILNDNSMEKAKLAEYIDILKYKKQIILQGPPGTGKTYTAKRIAEQLAGKRNVSQYNSLTPEIIKSSFEVGQRIANASGKKDFYSINEINENEIVLQSDKSQPWKANYIKTISKFKELTEGVEPKNTNALDPYELAVARYLFEKIKPSKVKTKTNYTLVQFHPSYSYEDFVRGITVKNENDSIVYKTENKVISELSKLASKKNSLENYDLASTYSNYLIQMEEEAASKGTYYYFDKEKTLRLKDVRVYSGNEGNLRYEIKANGEKWTMQTWIDIKETFNYQKWNETDAHKLSSYENSFHYSIWKDFDAFVRKLKNNDYVLIIDEINRANLPSVLGELVYALEYRGEAVNSMYSIDNDATITIPENLYIIGTMNTADRSVGHIDYAIKRRFAFVDMLPNAEVITNDKANALFHKVSQLFTDKYLASDFDAKDVHLGHSYFLLNENSDIDESEQLQLKLDYEILPILNEYVKDGLLLETAKELIKEISQFEC